VTVFRIHPAVADAFPDTRIALVAVTGLRGHEPWPATAAALDDLEQRLADGSWRPAGENDPLIHAAVDSYNAVSVRHGLPAGAFDLEKVLGDVEIRYADGSEEFTPLGEPGTVEQPKPGEVVYADEGGILTRHWNHRDAHRTRVTEDSARVVFVLETVHATRDGGVLKAAVDELRDLLAPHAEQTHVHHLDAARPSADV
jgi:DNA/RNA-binding domain of Phe-tRNA-synthetase-like protein